jgi:hypothetical protein
VNHLEPLSAYNSRTMSRPYVIPRSLRLRTPVLLAAVFAAFLPPANTAAPRPQETLLRTVQGVVFDSQKNPLSSAVVYIHNLRTHRVRSYITGKQGRYHFAGLRPYDDYELHAEYRKLTSAKHTLSAFDSKRDLFVELVVDHHQSQ